MLVKNEWKVLLALVKMHESKLVEKIDSYSRMLDAIAAKKQQEGDAARYMMYYDMKSEAEESLKRVENLKRKLENIEQEAG